MAFFITYSIFISDCVSSMFPTLWIVPVFLVIYAIGWTRVSCISPRLSHFIWLSAAEFGACFPVKWSGCFQDVRAQHQSYVIFVLCRKNTGRCENMSNDKTLQLST